MRKPFRHFILFLFSLSVVCSLALPTYAHPGKTDSGGGHWDRSAGVYHYHHGYSAHDHYDMDGDGVVDCPYDFVDKTDRSGSSGSPSSASSYNYPTLSKEPLTATSAKESATKANPNEGVYTMSWTSVFGDFILLIVLIPLLLSILISPYILLVYILSVILGFIMKPFTKKLDQDKREARSILAANILLIVLLTVYFLPSVVNELTHSPDILAVVIIFAILVLFILVCVCINMYKKNDSLTISNHALHRDTSELNEKLTAMERNYASSQKALASQQESASLRLESMTAFKNKRIEALERENETLRKELHAALSCRKTSVIPQPDTQEESVASQIPPGVYFDRNGIPVKGSITATKPFGDYTVFVSPNSKVYHSEFICGNSYSTRPKHIYDVIEHHRPCLKCGKSFGDTVPDWYAGAKKLLKSNQ